MVTNTISQIYYRERAEKLRNWYTLLTVTEKAKVNEYQYLLAAYGLTDKEEVLFYNSKDFGVPQSRKRVYIIGYFRERCAGEIEVIKKLLTKGFDCIPLLIIP